MKKLVIFDLDGTAIDTIEDICDAMNKMAKHYGFNKVSVDQMKKALGGSSREITRLAIGKKIPDQLLDECEAYYTREYIAGGSPKTKPFDKIKEVIAQLKNRGYKIVALSNKPDNEIVVLKERLLDPMGFDKVVGLSDKVAPKPDPTATLNLMQEFNVGKQDTYFVGDGETDVLTAINAGVNLVAVLWGNRNKEFLSNYGAKVFANNPLELLDIIK